MTLVIALNAVLAVLIVSAIVALHTFAILSDRPRRRRPARVVGSRPEPVRLRPRPSVPARRAETRLGGADRDKVAAAG